MFHVLEVIEMEVLFQTQIRRAPEFWSDNEKHRARFLRHAVRMYSVYRDAL